MKYITIVLIVSCSAIALPWGSVSSGFEISPLAWEQGTHTPWSFYLAVGPRVFNDVFIRAKLSYPIPSMIIIGNQFCVGGEVEWLTRNPQTGFAVKTSAGASWCATWPENIIVILADGDTVEPPEPKPFDNASGTRYLALAGLGWRFEIGAIWLDLGLDHRRLSVSRFINNTKVIEDFSFTGPHFGISTELFF